MLVSCSPTCLGYSKVLKRTLGEIHNAEHNDLNEGGAQGLKSMGEEEDNRTQVKHMMLIKMRETKCGNVKRKHREA